MDCRIYLPDGQTVDVPNVLNIKAVPVVDGDKRRVVVALYNDDNQQPVASFYDALGYQLIGRRS